ncbi:RNA-directed DNA polymerase [Bacillus toyonensis]|uniref:RNA-directed DNA polymerase n=1 Tax=Bacillus toyonensis TaxID=155322 RepID=UPI0023789975|nr:RNA-directed DNA polymerase [Bacillus toyonensis]MDD9265045.1 RNA-directed DNA polymerase [Bacillus toyonensis]
MTRQMRLTLQNFVEKGYFPPELIPPFTTKELSQHVNSIYPSLAGMNITINGEKISSSKHAIHTIPKVLHQRRTLGIPNPFHQIKLMQTIVDNWQDIKSITSKSKYSLTKPQVKKDLPRAINREHIFSEISSKLPILSAGYRYVLRTDISRFFPTIYTHSIPWACHGKTFAKKNRKNTHFGNALDTNIRNTQDQQTFGIPIGPDSSYIISEIIGSVMDVEIYKELSTEGIRYTDDFYFFFNSLSEAEEGLTKLQKILKKFELEINPDKTEIYQLPQALEYNWTSEIRNYEFHNKIRRQKTDLVTFFSKAFNFSKKYPNEYVLKYALARIRNELIHKENWEFYESLILNSMIAEPSVLPIALEIFLAYQKLGYNLNSKKMGKTVNNLISYHSKLGHGYEVSWSLWLAKALNIKINRTAAKELSTIDDSIAALTALDLRDAGLISAGLNVNEWNNYLTHENLYQEHWLFAYEAIKKGWLTTRTNYITSDPFFSILWTKNIEFYDKSQITTPANPSINNTSIQKKVSFVGGGGGGY